VSRFATSRLLQREIAEGYADEHPSSSMAGFHAPLTGRFCAPHDSHDYQVAWKPPDRASLPGDIEGVQLEEEFREIVRDRGDGLLKSFSELLMKTTLGTPGWLGIYVRAEDGFELNLATWVGTAEFASEFGGVVPLFDPPKPASGIARAWWGEANLEREEDFKARDLLQINLPLRFSFSTIGRQHGQ